MQFVGVFLILALLAYLVMNWAKWAGAARTREVVRALLLAGAIALLVLIAVRSGSVLISFMAVMLPLFARALSIWQRSAALRNAAFRAASAASSSTSEYSDKSSSSSVTTKFLKMTLSHADGDMQGTVLTGPFSGRELRNMSIESLLDLYTQCSSDAQSQAVLEAYLDRNHPQWRELQRHAPSSNADMPMDFEEACSILGLPPHADIAQIKEAHRRLMQKLHPDHGGSDYLAVRVNQAKELLLKKVTQNKR